jgi:predicted PurR-regulated permease PerM
VERAVGLHARGEIAVSVLSILSLAVIFRLGRLPLPMLPALAAGLLRLVPFFGVPMAAGAAFVAGSTVSVVTGAVTAAVTVVVLIAVDQIVARRLLAARRPSPTLTVLLVVALVDAYGVIGLVFASPLAMAIEACVARLLVTHAQATPHEQTLPELRARIEGTRRRLLAVPEPGATQLADLVSRLAALAAEAEGASPRAGSQLS